MAKERNEEVCILFCILCGKGNEEDPEDLPHPILIFSMRQKHGILNSVNPILYKI
ncbi:MAG: hypothetical protein JETT_0179 [Candidatus Jettenia ecosi]|uniref:Uncharacterized protein n=1 Tax=Candidatus Jettenia ecosi TaxID=2494326 RepID=A0A533QFI6_9BACT|nr:MAG: hypothetical protein JETT_0179 [Candidatus Jettenia ecosi]